MPDKKKRSTGEYVRKVTENAQSFMKDLQTENETLRGFVAALQSEKANIEARLKAEQESAAQFAATRANAEQRERELAQLKSRIQELSKELSGHRVQQTALAEQLARVSKERERASTRYVGLEQQITSLSNLFVASYRLHEAPGRDDLIGIIKEILANIIGSEQVAIFETNPSENTLVLIGSTGIEESRFQTLRIGEGTLGRAAQTGEIYIANGGAPETSGDEPPVNACIPLRSNGLITGLIAVFSLLPQKRALAAVDNELMELLATQAGMALYCSKLHARLGKGR